MHSSRAYENTRNNLRLIEPISFFPHLRNVRTYVIKYADSICLETQTRKYVTK